jgi:GntR family transcriptional regulator, transcriptional repressor for pyruvate dehydrogenase complex
MIFEPLLIGKVSEHIGRKIKEAILDGDLKPGSKLPSEKEMAEQLAVSIGSVRDALKSLKNLGLIRIEQGRSGGVYISEINDQIAKKSLGNFLAFNNLSIKHIYEMRKIIEPYVIHIAINNITPDIIKKLEENILSFEKKSKKIRLKPTKNDFVDLDKISLNFHKILIETTNNPLLIFISCYISDLIAALDEKRGHCNDIHFVNEGYYEHKKILKYIKQGNVRKCEKEMASHLNRLGEIVVEIEKKFLLEV